MTESNLRKKGFILTFMLQGIESILMGRSWKQAGKAEGQDQEADWSHFHLQTGNGMKLKTLKTRPW